MPIPIQMSTMSANHMAVERLEGNNKLTEAEKIGEVSRHFEAILLRQFVGKALQPMFGGGGMGGGTCVGTDEEPPGRLASLLVVCSALILRIIAACRARPLACAASSSAVAEACARSGDAFTIEHLYVNRIPKSARGEREILEQCGLHHQQITRQAARILGLVTA